MTGFDIKIEGKTIIIHARSDNPESEKWTRVEWLQWIQGWCDTMITLHKCGVL